MWLHAPVFDREGVIPLMGFDRNYLLPGQGAIKNRFHLILVNNSWKKIHVGKLGPKLSTK
jgi:hypothetical protein